MINKALNKLNYRLFNIDFLNSKYTHVGNYWGLFELMIKKHLHKDFFFIQIGANDGVTNDPLFHVVSQSKDSIHGICLEPVPEIYEKLKYNYRNFPNIKPLNYAIHNTEEYMEIFQVNTQIEKYAKRTGTSSFFRSHHKDVEDKDIITHKVKCISLSDLIKEQNIKHIDLLQIDTEGYDYQILKSIDFTIVKPTIISFEHGVRMGIMTKEQLFEIQNLLMDNGYSVLVDEHDVRAYLIS